MKKLPLVWNRLRCIVLVLSVSIVGALWAPLRAQNDTFGEVIPLPGHVDEVIMDEARGLLYAVSFSAGRVEVVSMASNQRVSSFLASTTANALVAAAMSHDSRFLVVAVLAPPSPLPQAVPGSLTVINLNDPADRRSIPMTEQPLGVAFGRLGTALVVTTQSFQLFDPDDGSFQKLFDYAQISGPEDIPDVLLPIEIKTFPREVVKANLTSSRDGSWIFGIARTPNEPDGFVFSHRVALPRGFTRIRPLRTMVSPPAFSQVSTADDGSYFMAGDLLLTQQMRVIADTPEAPDDPDDTDSLFGGHVIDSGIDTVYASFNTEVTGDLPGQEQTGVLQVMDADNLLVRQRIRISERVSGRLVTDAQGRDLYAVGQSGLIHIPISTLSQASNLEINRDDRDLLFEFNFCARDPQTQTLRIESPSGGTANFQLSEASGMGGLLFEPDQGTTPADVQVTVDPAAFGPVQGTGIFDVTIQTDAVNVPMQTQIFANIRGVDQKGVFHAQSGSLVDILGDPQRDRFYVLDQENFQVMVYDSNDFRLLGSFRTGNTPTWMSLGNRGFFLFVANSRSENLTVINLTEMRSDGPVFLPWETLRDGHYPISVATDNASIVIPAKVSESVGDTIPCGDSGQVVLMTTPTFHATKPQTLGIFQNCIDPLTAAVPAPNGSGVLLAMADGRTAFWEALTRKVVLSRDDFGGQGLKGAIGSGSDFFLVGNHLLNRSLVPQVDFDDAGGGQESSGFALLANGLAARSTRPAEGVNPGILQQFDPRDPRRIINPVRMADQPPAGPDDPDIFPFTRSLAALSNGKLASLGTAGLLEFPVGYETQVTNPRLFAMVNAADFTSNLAPGGLVSLFGEDLAPQTASSSSTPLPTVLGNVCVTADGANLPLLHVSPEQINAQLPFNASGDISTIVHTPGGVSDILVSEVSTTAPAVFNVRAPSNALHPAIFRLSDNKLVTLSTPLRPNDTAVIFLTGLGQVTPLAVEGFPAPQTPLAQTVADPFVVLGERLTEVRFSGLAPGFVGLYQMNVFIPGDVPPGLEVPLTIVAGSSSTSVNVRVAKD